MPNWSFNTAVRAPLLMMAGVEAIILFSSVYVAGMLVCGSLEECEQLFGSLAPKAVVVSLVIMVSLVAMGLYQFHQRIYFREVVARVLVGAAAGSIALAAIFYALPSVMLSREIILVAVIYALVLVLLVRYFFISNVDESRFRRRTLVFGAGDRAESIADLRRRADRRGFRLVGTIKAPGDTINGRTDILHTNGTSIADVAMELDADEIVVAMDNRRGNLPVRDLLDARLNGIEVIDLLQFLERESGKIRVDLVNPGWLIFGPGFRKSKFRQFTKRVVDIVVSSVLLLFTWPLFLAVVIAIKIEDGWKAPIFYKQGRVGQNSNVFEVLKFRSMGIDAEADGKAVWAQENDDRVTRVGTTLRKFRIDEIPQALNVLRGQMSLVGPRPERPEFVEELSENIPYFTARHTLKPGVTGWAQIKYPYGASEHDAMEKLHFDLYYVKNHNLLFDIAIILQTAEIIVWGRGAR